MFKRRCGELYLYLNQPLFIVELMQEIYVKLFLTYLQFQLVDVETSKQPVNEAYMQFMPSYIVSLAAAKYGKKVAVLDYVSPSTQGKKVGCRFHFGFNLDGPRVSLQAGHQAI